jgi:cytoskeletal protein CcmA (bactofilin family)
VIGDLKFSGNLEILGSVVGNVSSEDSGSRVRILHGGSVKGDIKCSLIEINGNAEGNIFAREHLSIEEQSEIEGNIHYSSVEMQTGARVRGTFSYQKLQQDGRLSTEETVGGAKVKAISQSKQVAE